MIFFAASFTKLSAFSRFIFWISVGATCAITNKLSMSFSHRIYFPYHTTYHTLFLYTDSVFYLALKSHFLDSDRIQKETGIPVSFLSYTVLSPIISSLRSTDYLYPHTTFFSYLTHFSTFSTWNPTAWAICSSGNPSFRRFMAVNSACVSRPSS